MKNITKLCQLVGITSTMHLLVDGLCVCTLYMMYNSFPVPHVFEVFLAYNLLAFLTQPFTGMIADKSKKMHWIAITSAVLLTFAVLLASVIISSPTLCTSSLAVFMVSVLLGFGNSLFHVWGGKQVVVKAGNDMRPLGVFVSTGAFGLAIGFVFCSWTLLYALLLSICILTLLYIYIDSKEPKIHYLLTEEKETDKEDISFSYSIVWLFVTAIALFVFLRSFVGETFSSCIHKNPTILLIIGAVGMLGKMAGGWLGKWFGIIRSMTIILIIVALCFVFKNSSEWYSITGLFVMNLTMPITLYLANYLMKGKEGLAFGILAAALIPGYYLAFIS